MDSRFTHRSSEREIMDDLNCSGPVVRQTLHELEVINAWLGGNKVTLDGVRYLLAGIPNTRTITVADLGCGGGDIARLLIKRLNRKGNSLVVTGVDANPNIIAMAKDRHGEVVRFIAMDIFSKAFSQLKFDIVTATLFFHHFTSTELVQLFKQLLHQAAIGIVVNDIHRHWFSYHSIRILTRLFSRSPMVRHDAPVSVLRAFSKQELVDILGRAGCDNYRIRWRWAFRWQVIIHRH
jgi:2-polyprenyl-3-methyl-5-hydroxy-6-metoxy-1,4-benzoquinol methylase